MEGTYGSVGMVHITRLEGEGVDHLLGSSGWST